MKKLALFLALMLVTLSFAACADNGYEKVIENYYAALNDEDGDAALALYDDYFLEYACDAADIDFEDDVDKYAKTIKSTLKAYNKMIEEKYDDDIDGLNEITYVIDDVTFYDDEDEFEALVDYLDDEFGYDAKAIEKIALLEIEETYVGDEDEESDDIEVVVIKVDGKWYICPALGNEDMLDAIIDGDIEDAAKKALGNAAEAAATMYEEYVVAPEFWG